MNHNQTIPAIETWYQGIVFRSRLEAKWAAMFDLLKWGWTYEPTDFNGWIPDFAIHGKEIIYVEVKPVYAFPEDVAKKINFKGLPNEVLIVGMLGPMKGDWESPTIGWLRHNLASTEDGETKSVWWAEAVMGRYRTSDRIGFCHSYGSFTDRISGGHDGGRFGTYPVTLEDVTMLWREASNRTRWNPKK